MAELIASDPTIKKQENDYLKNENTRLTKQVSALQMEQDKLKYKLNQVEQRSLDHCLLLKGVCEMAKENEKDCIELVYNVVSNTSVMQITLWRTKASWNQVFMWTVSTLVISSTEESCYNQY